MIATSEAQATDRRRVVAPTALAVIAAATGFLLLATIAVQQFREWDCNQIVWLPQACFRESFGQALRLQMRSWDTWLPQFLAMTLIGIALAERGWRHLFVVPAVCLVLIPRVIGSWPQSLAESPWRSAFLGPGAEAALATVGGALVADRLRGRPRPQRHWRDAAASVLCVVAFAVIVWVRGTRGDHPWSDGGNVFLVLPLLFGAGVGIRKPWFPWAHILVPFMLGAGNYGQWWLHEPSSWGAALPFIGVAFVGALREPLGRTLSRLDSKPLHSFIVLQVFNIADALLTGLGLARGNVSEANPIARWIGMPAKIILVGVAGWLLLRWRPRWLLLPVLVLAGVLAYHIGGLVVNG